MMSSLNAYNAIGRRVNRRNCLEELKRVSCLDASPDRQSFFPNWIANDQFRF